MPTHIRKRDTRDDTAWANRQIVHIAASLARPGWDGMYPDRKSRQLHEARDLLVPGPCLGTLQAV